MTQPTFQFTTPGNQPNDNAGLQQYIAQGQNAIDPGKAQVAASSPVSAAGGANLAAALAALKAQNPQQLPADISQSALGTGAAMNPNSPSGENMGGVGPTQQNLALAQGLQNAAQLPPNAQGGFVPQGPNPYGVSYGG